MRFRFYIVSAKQRELDVGTAVGEGVRRSGDEFELVDAKTYDEPDPSIDIAGVFALKGAAKTILDGYRAIGARTLLVDKGLIRSSTGMGGPHGYFRVSLDEFMPLGRIERMMREGVSMQRWIDTGMKPRNYAKARLDAPVIYAGSSQKYCDFHDLGDEHEYAEELLRKLRKATPKARPLIYRPKPSFAEARRVEGIGFSRPPEMLGQILPGAFALVTHGSHAGIDSILAGVPTVVLGPGAARPVSATDFDGLAERPWYPGQELRARWLGAIAHWQWTVPEMVDGTMWRFLREEMEKPAV